MVHVLCVSMYKFCGCVYAPCARLTHLLPACVARAITLILRPPPAGEAAPGGREWSTSWSETMGGEIPFKSRSDDTANAESLSTLSRLFSLCLLYRRRRWEDMQQASLTPEANGCEFTPHIRWFLSKYCFTAFDISSHFHRAFESLATRAALEKKWHGSLLFSGSCWTAGAWSKKKEASLAIKTARFQLCI